MKSEPTVKNLFGDVKIVKGDALPIYNTSISGSTSSCSDSIGFIEVLKNNYVGDPKFTEVIVENAPKDDFWDNVEFITAEMNKQLKNTGDNFKKSIESFISAPSNEKYKRLMDIRQAVFDNFFDIIISTQAMYCKLNWYKNNPSKAKVYCQTKFYIQDSLDDDILFSSSVTNINRLSQDMHDVYDNISQWGHEGISDDFAEYFVKREVVPTFKSVLETKL